MKLSIRPFKGKRVQKKRDDLYNLFLSLFHPNRSNTILDIGGQGGDFFEKRYPFKTNITVVDIDKKAILNLKTKFPDCNAIVADAISLPFKNKSFDYVLSAEVIEHVGDWERQLLFAKEVRRLCKRGYFISTPNYWFPWEFHYQMPFWQYLPKRLKKTISKYLSIGFYKKGEYEDINLLSAYKLERLLPDGTIVKKGIQFIPENLIIYRQIDV